jgi:hypothetical protein
MITMEYLVFGKTEILVTVGYCSKRQVLRDLPVPFAPATNLGVRLYIGESQTSLGLNDRGLGSEGSNWSRFA